MANKVARVFLSLQDLSAPKESTNTGPFALNFGHLIFIAILGKVGTINRLFNNVQGTSFLYAHKRTSLAAETSCKRERDLAGVYSIVTLEVSLWRKEEGCLTDSIS